MPALGGCPLLPLVNVLVYLLSPLSSRRRTNASESDFEPDDWRWFLGLLFLGDVLLLGVPLWLVEVALMNSSKKSDVSLSVLNKTKVLTLGCMHMPTSIAKRAWMWAVAEF